MEMKLYQINKRPLTTPESASVGELQLDIVKQDKKDSTRRFYIETYGCQMNVHDSEKAAAVLAGIGYQQVVRPEEADLLLLNTCMVREKPQQKVYSRVGALKRGDKRRSPGSEKSSPIIGIMGCVAQAEAEKIFAKSPAVRLVVGTHSIHKLPLLIEQLDNGFPRAIDIRLTKEPDFLELSPSEHQTPNVAFITIIEGCDNFCSFCIVPFTRGRERSRPAVRILAEARGLVAHGYQEVQLLGQNVNSYRGSFIDVEELSSGWLPQANAKRTPFVMLLELMARESGLARIKYTTSHPRDFNEQIVAVMDEYENLCPWVHLPAQSGSTRILELMSREYTREEYLNKIAAIKHARRDISITGDMIVGYPGETEADFAETLSLVREVEYDGLYMFKYSPRPHTPAAKLTDTIPDEVKTERLLRLQTLQGEIQRRRFQRYLGREVEVLVEGPAARGQGQLSGHTACNKVVNFAAPLSLVGQLVRVRITAATPNSLLGECLSRAASNN
ncbi:MAG: tRNA (N6-isopentenyl adenosine(37)-C2)-methylthiotransferase MiaB [Acidobacteriota bacterium]